jgi:hypothetical protein
MKPPGDVDTAFAPVVAAFARDRKERVAEMVKAGIDQLFDPGHAEETMIV